MNISSEWREPRLRLEGETGDIQSPTMGSTGDHASGEANKIDLKKK